jgi:hypothetical protein
MNTSNEIDDKICHWFLNQAVFFPHLVSLITPLDRYDVPSTKINIYCTPFNLSTDQSVNVLQGLFESGLLLGIRGSDSYEVELAYQNSPHKPTMEEMISKSFIPSHKEIRKALMQEEDENGNELYYFLTQKGGELWESVFKPNWELYLTRRSRDSESSSRDIIHVIDCKNLIIGRKLILVDSLLSLDEENSFRPIPNTEEVEIITPWQTLYWQTLPVGYSISYQSQLIDKNSYEISELKEEIKEASEWLDNIWRWCRKDYFDDWLTLKIDS